MANVPLKSIKFPGLDDTYTVPVVDSSLTQSGAAADAKVAGDKVGELKSAIIDYNCIDLMPMRGSTTSRNVTLTTQTDGTYKMSGTASATTSISLYNVNAFPKGINAGETYAVKCVIPVSGVKIRFYKYVNGAVGSTPFLDITASTQNGSVTIPNDAEGLNIAIYIPNRTAFSDSTLYLHIFDAKSNQELEELIQRFGVLNPDVYGGGDTNKLQSCINALVNGGTGGIIFINRKYTVNSNLVCNLRTDSADVYNDKVFITFIGIGENAGIEFGSSSVSIKGNDDGSPYGGLRFINMNFTRPSASIGYGNAFTQMQGLVRSVFENCRFNGFKSVFECTDVGDASMKIIQNLVCINCYFSNCSDYVIDAYTLGDVNKAPYLYAVNFYSCIVEKCKGLVKGSASSGYSVWTNVNIENCTIENCTGIPIVFGVGARGITIKKCYFEKCDYNNTNICIDMSSLFGSNHENPAKVRGIDISDNVFVKGISSGNYIAHCTALKIPTFESVSDTDNPELLHGVIARNVVEDVFFAYEEDSFENKLRFKLEDNYLDEEFDDSMFYQYVNPYGTSRPTNPKAGYTMFDSSIGKAIWYTGTRWVDASGTIVS